MKIAGEKNNWPVIPCRVSIIAALVLFWFAQGVFPKSINANSPKEISQSTIAKSVFDEPVLSELRYHLLLSHASESEINKAIKLVSLGAKNHIPPERTSLLMIFYLEKAMTPTESLRHAEEETTRIILSRYNLRRHAGESFSFDPAAFLKNIGGFIGTRYKWGGKSRRGTDCSGFSWNILKGMGVLIPRMSATDYFYSGNFVPVDKKSLRPGDLVFFRCGKGDRVNHVGIYLGNDKFAHASKGAGKVSISNLKTPYWIRHWAGARRSF